MHAPQTKALGRMIGHICKCGATIICLPKVQTCTKKHVNSKHLCILCMDNPLEVVFVPCGHIVTCTNCISQIDEKKILKRRRLKLYHTSYVKLLLKEF